MSFSEETKSIDSSDYDSMSLAESLDGSPHKTKKKKRLGLFRKKHKEEKVFDSISVEKDTGKFSVSSSLEVSSTSFDRQSLIEDVNEINHELLNGNGIPPQMTGNRKMRSSGSFNKKSPTSSADSHILHIRLRAGEHLAARDANGLSDPYVKFKVDGRTAYKSKVCKGTLYPKWDEEFQLSISILSEVIIRVFDKDIASRDDFMGGGRLDLHRLNNEFENITIELEDPDANEDLGYIHFEAKIESNFAAPVAQKSRDSLDMADHALSAISGSSALERTKTLAAKESFRQKNPTINRHGNQHAVAVATLQLVTGSELPARDTNGLSDPYVKLNLGKSRRKSKVCYKTLNPVWKEEFTFFLHTPESSVLEITVWDKDSYRKDDFIGRCELNLWSLVREETHSLLLNLVDTPGTLHVLVTVHAIEAPDVPVTRYDLSQIRLKYGLSSTFKNLSDVGFAEVRIVSASGLRSADLNGKSDPFCVAHLCNARAQTHTCQRTLEPVWNRVFNFPLHDIHDVFDFWIYDQDPNYEKEFLGRVCIPILRCVNGEEKTYCLKDKKLKERVKGTITVQISYIFNPVRAAIRTLSPREEVLMDEAAKFKKALLTQNFSRLWGILQHIFAGAEFFNSCFTWQNKTRSALAFLMFLIVVWNFELYMLPVALLMLLMKNYLDIFVRKTRPPRHLMNAEEAQRAGNEEDDDEEENGNKLNLIQKLRAVEEVLTKVQVILDKIASIGERVYNTFFWSVPFLGWLLVTVLIVAYLVLYFIPLRIIILLWGINKFTKRLRKPNFIPNNEVMDYLSRVPSNIELDQYREITSEVSPTHSKKKR